MNINITGKSTRNPENLQIAISNFVYQTTGIRANVTININESANTFAKLFNRKENG